eukprot:CAMPEP_0177637258 /NCGR_PEP_ID=MMETSP0447-20121125/4878_1 /TAXON_ID=0 /ORGANISM="Stygamoeba regulata, Strain BSH-02190019" /LENGTH=223 /DNA_ID=CAMNT_0019139179 /DNA_START=34 /DNA_END=702 /DNA_ORIENTATION=+
MDLSILWSFGEAGPFVITSVVALLWLALLERLQVKGYISRPDSRKLVHFGTGPIFVVCWSLFSEDHNARYYAALVPLLITLRFFLIGIGVLQDHATVLAMSRSGRKEELLKGPLTYGIIFVLCTIYYWKYDPIGIIALMILCAGDGFADLIGRRFGGRYKLPHNRRKSYAGSIAFVVASMLVTVPLLNYFYTWGWFRVRVSVTRLFWVVFGSMLVESLPLEDW